MSQSELADKVGISYAQIGLYETKELNVFVVNGKVSEIQKAKSLK